MWYTEAIPPPGFPLNYPLHNMESIWAKNELKCVLITMGQHKGALITRANEDCLWQWSTGDIFQRLLLRIVPFVCQNHLNCKRLLKPWNISVVSSIFRLSKWCTSTLWTCVIWIHPCRKSRVGKVGDNSGANSPLWPIVGILSTAPSSQAWTECVHCLTEGGGGGCL